MDWYPWYFQIYKADTMHLDHYQDCCYRRLIDHYMETRQPLPDNDQALARIIQDSGANWHAMACAIVRPFFRAENGLLFHAKCDEILDFQDKSSKKMSTLGKKGAEKRWKKSKQSQTVNSEPIAPAKAHAIAHAIAQDNTIQDKKERKSAAAPSKPNPKDDKNSPAYDPPWFAGNVIKLRRSDFDAWRKRYPGSEQQFETWLSERDDWIATQAPEHRSRWFISTSKMLEKMENA